MEAPQSYTFERLRTEVWRAGPDGTGLVQTLLNHVAHAQGSQLHPEFAATYDELRDSPLTALSAESAKFRAALGVFLFCHYAEHWHSASPIAGNINEATRAAGEASQARVQRILSDPLTLNLLYQIYHLPKEHCHDQLHLHAVGTSSFVLSTFDRKCAIKLVKPWYFQNKDITKNTSYYFSRYAALSEIIPQSTPRLYDSGKYYIVMDLLISMTLGQYVIKNYTSEKYPDDLKFIFCSLLKDLDSCAKSSANIRHGDLSSTNILIDDVTDKDNLRVFMIDFGVNYSVNQVVGSLERMHQAHLSIPEKFIRAKGNIHKIEIDDDIYSLGFVLIQCLLGKVYSLDNLDGLLDRMYRRHLHAAFLVDLMLHPTPEDRARWSSNDQETYCHLETAIVNEILLIRSRQAKKRFPFRMAEHTLGALSPVGIRDAKEYMEKITSKKRRTGPFAIAETRNEIHPIQFVIVLIATVCNAVAIIGFLLKLGLSGNPTQWTTNEELRSHILGWIVTLCYAIVASRYIVFLIGSVPLKRLSRFAAATSSICGIAVWPVILYPLLVDASAWPQCVAVGLIIIALNNFAWHCFSANLAMELKHRKYRQSSLMLEAIDDLNEWTGLMSAFALFVVVFNVLLAKDLVHDVTFFGLLIAVLATARMYVLQLGRDAPKIRAGVHRLLNAIDHARAEGGPLKEQPPRLVLCLWKRG